MESKVKFNKYKFFRGKLSKKLQIMKTNVCNQNKCIKCCIQTSMLLSNKDVDKIQKLGYNQNFFIKNQKDWMILKNLNGRCVFHNKKLCLIYTNRPMGCKLYPLIFNKEYESAVLDEECPYKDSFRFTSKDNKKLYNLIIKLKFERKNRKRNPIKNFLMVLMINF